MTIDEKLIRAALNCFNDKAALEAYERQITDLSARATKAETRAAELEAKFCPSCDRTNWEKRVRDGCDICKLPDEPVSPYHIPSAAHARQIAHEIGYGTSKKPAPTPLPSSPGATGPGMQHLLGGFTGAYSGNEERLRAAPTTTGEVAPLTYEQAMSVAQQTGWSEYILSAQQWEAMAVEKREQFVSEMKSGKLHERVMAILNVPSEPATTTGEGKSDV